MSKLNGVIGCYTDFTLFHNVNKDGSLGPGTNLSINNLKKIYKALNFNNVKFMAFEDIIPENVLWYDQFDEAVIFYTEPQMRNLYFTDGTKIPSGEYKMPYLLWVYKNQKLSVYALKKKPKDSKEELYQAPFMNVSSSGMVCMGNVKYGEGMNTFNELIEDIINKFFGSYFSHTQTNDLLKMNYSLFLKNHVNDRNFSYAKILVKTKLTLKDII